MGYELEILDQAGYGRGKPGELLRIGEKVEQRGGHQLLSLFDPEKTWPIDVLTTRFGLV